MYLHSRRLEIWSKDPTTADFLPIEKICSINRHSKNSTFRRKRRYSLPSHVGLLASESDSELSALSSAGFDVGDDRHGQVDFGHDHRREKWVNSRILLDRRSRENAKTRGRQRHSLSFSGSLGTILPTLKSSITAVSASLRSPKSAEADEITSEKPYGELESSPTASPPLSDFPSASPSSSLIKQSFPLNERSSILPSADAPELGDINSLSDMISIQESPAKSIVRLVDISKITDKGQSPPESVPVGDVVVDRDRCPDATSSRTIPATSESGGTDSATVNSIDQSPETRAPFPSRIASLTVDTALAEATSSAEAHHSPLNSAGLRKRRSANWRSYTSPRSKLKDRPAVGKGRLPSGSGLLYIFLREFLVVSTWAMASQTGKYVAYLISRLCLHLVGMEFSKFWYLLQRFVLCLSFSLAGTGALSNPATGLQFVIRGNLRGSHLFFLTIIDIFAYTCGYLMLKTFSPTVWAFVSPYSLHPTLTFSMGVGVECMLCLVACCWKRMTENWGSLGTASNVFVVKVLGKAIARDLTGSAMNPAAATARAFIHMDLRDLGVYWLGPMLGYMLGAFLQILVCSPHGKLQGEQSPRNGMELTSSSLDNGRPVSKDRSETRGNGTGDSHQRHIRHKSRRSQRHHRRWVGTGLANGAEHKHLHVPVCPIFLHARVCSCAETRERTQNQLTHFS